MKIITWNCNMAFRKKAEYILGEKPDIIIVPECEHPDKLKFNKALPLPADMLWYGDNQNKGLGVFSYSRYRFKLLDVHNSELKIILPIAVTGGDTDFILFAIWAYNPNDPLYNYIGQVWKAIHHYEEILKSRPVILAGDFNSNKIWDKPRRKSNHSDVVNKLVSLAIHSTYHQYLKAEQGVEKHPTFYLYRQKEKPYHIDYCFASADYMARLEKVEVGLHEEWSKHSDHIPLVVTFSDAGDVPLPHSSA